MAIRAGQIIRAMDFAGYASVFDQTDELNFNSTTFIPGSNVVGTTFMAPSSGAVVVNFAARMRLNNASGARVLVMSETRTGGTIGSGTIVSLATEDVALEIGQTTGNQLNSSMFQVVTGLTAGSTYNVRLLHKNGTAFASAATVYARSINVAPHQI